MCVSHDIHMTSHHFSMNIHFWQPRFCLIHRQERASAVLRELCGYLVRLTGKFITTWGRPHWKNGEVWDKLWSFAQIEWAIENVWGCLRDFSEGTSNFRGPTCYTYLNQQLLNNIYRWIFSNLWKCVRPSIHEPRWYPGSQTSTPKNVVEFYGWWQTKNMIFYSNSILGGSWPTSIPQKYYIVFMVS